MKTRLAASLALVAVIATAVWAEETNVLEKAKCLISGKPVSADAAVAYKDAKVYFCCENCPAAFQKDTKKFAAKANHQLALTGQYKQEKCPLSGGKLNDETKVEVAGTKVAFCCANCQKKAEGAEGDARVNLVYGEEAFKKAFVIAKKDDK